MIPDPLRTGGQNTSPFYLKRKTGGYSSVINRILAGRLNLFLGNVLPSTSVIQVVLRVRSKISLLNCHNLTDVQVIVS